MTITRAVYPRLTIYGLSTDTKPTGEPIGTIFMENDSGKEYECYSDGNWIERKLTMITYPTKAIIKITAAYTIKVTDELIDVDSSSGAIAITLATAACGNGKPYTFADAGGIAGTNNITLTPESGLINGAANFVMNVDRMAVSIHGDGTNWIIDA